MNLLTKNIHWIVGATGSFILANGLLHDFFVLQLDKPFEKDLIRLLIDGHILIFGGILFLLCFKPLKARSNLALSVCIVNALFLLGYCALIFKLIPAVGIIVLCFLVLIASVKLKFF